MTTTGAGVGACSFSVPAEAAAAKLLSRLGLSALAYATQNAVDGHSAGDIAATRYWLEVMDAMNATDSEISNRGKIASHGVKR